MMTWSPVVSRNYLDRGDTGFVSLHQQTPGVGSMLGHLIL